MEKLNQSEIQQYLKEHVSIVLLDEIDSTNTYAKTNETIQPKTLIATTYQTKGRGRYNRFFYSPQDAGLYFSYVISPKLEDLELMTLKMAVAVCLSLEELGLNPSVKWLNDIFLNQKKASGILCEGVFQNNRLLKFIIGVGINVEKAPALESLKDSMISLEECGLKYINYNRLLARIINHFHTLNDNTMMLNMYRERCFTLGKIVTINGTTGTALEINDQGYIVLETKENERITIRTGEIQ